MKYINIQDHIKKYIKAICLLPLIVIVTGCSINYDITINEDLTIDEKINIKENEFRFYESDLTSTVDLYKHFNINKNISSNNVQITMSRESNISNINNELKNYLSLNNKEYNVIDENNKIKINVNFKEAFLNFMQSNMSEDALISEIKLNINAPHHIIETNADIINENIHTWILNETNIYNKELTIELNKNVFVKDVVNYSWLIWVALVAIVIAFIIITYKKVINRNNGIWKKQYF